MRGKSGLFSRRPFFAEGLTGWWDAADSQTLFSDTTGTSLASADGAVALWKDKSGTGRHVSQSTAGREPTRKTSVRNALDVLRFDGVNDRLSSTWIFSSFVSSTECTVFVVAKATAVNTDSSTNPEFNDVVISEGGGVHGFVSLRSSGTAGVFGYDNQYRQPALSYSAGDWKVFTSRHASSSLSFRINGGSPASETLNTRTFMGNTVNFGCNNSQTVFFDGDVAEIISYNVALSDADRESVESYLMNKWAIT